MKHFLLSLALVAALMGQAMGQTIKGSAVLPPQKRAALDVLRVASNVADTETVTIGTTVFEVDTAASPGAITAGRIRVDCSSGVTPTIFTTQLVTAINATNVLGFRFKATKISNSEVLVEAAVPGAQGNATAATETLAGSNNAWAAATFYGGDSTPETEHQVAVLSRAATATEAALLTLHFVAPFAPTTALVQVKTSAGVLVAFDGSVTITGNHVDVASGGSVPVASTNIVTVTVSK